MRGLLACFMEIVKLFILKDGAVYNMDQQPVSEKGQIVYMEGFAGSKVSVRTTQLSYRSTVAVTFPI